MSRLVDLYPRAWRARYGEELEDPRGGRGPGLGGSIDLPRGASMPTATPSSSTRRQPARAGPSRSRQRYEDLRRPAGWARGRSPAPSPGRRGDRRHQRSDRRRRRRSTATAWRRCRSCCSRWCCCRRAHGSVIRIGRRPSRREAGASVAIFAGRCGASGRGSSRSGSSGSSASLPSPRPRGGGAPCRRGRPAGALARHLPRGLLVAVTAAGDPGRRSTALAPAISSSPVIAALAPIWLAVGGDAPRAARHRATRRSGRSIPGRRPRAPDRPARRPGPPRRLAGWRSTATASARSWASS